MRPAADLVYNRDGRALRIRPSQGDYGIDIILPAAADPEQGDVYQVQMVQEVKSDYPSEYVAIEAVASWESALA